MFITQCEMELQDVELAYKIEWHPQLQEQLQLLGSDWNYSIY